MGADHAVPKPSQPLRRGAEAYGRVLSEAGGKETEALERDDGGIAISVSLYASPPYALSVPPLGVSRLSVNLTPARVIGGIEGDRPRSFDARRHSLFLTPAGQPVSWRKESPSRHLNIYFQRDVFGAGDQDASPLATAPTLLNASIPGIGELVEQLVVELRCPSVMSAEAADSCARLLLIHVARHGRRTSKTLQPLKPDDLARLRDFVIAHLGERILVADLAKQAGLSLNHFAISFAGQTGQTPHKFVLALRVERAAAMLTRSNASLAAIAHDCGFASQQHLCHAVRRHLGKTPSSLRAQRKR